VAGTAFSCGLYLLIGLDGDAASWRRAQPLSSPSRARRVFGIRRSSPTYPVTISSASSFRGLPHDPRLAGDVLRVLLRGIQPITCLPGPARPRQTPTCRTPSPPLADRLSTTSPSMPIPASTSTRRPITTWPNPNPSRTSTSIRAPAPEAQPRPSTWSWASRAQIPLRLILHRFSTHPQGSLTPTHANCTLLKAPEMAFGIPIPRESSKGRGRKCATCGSGRGGTPGTPRFSRSSPRRPRGEELLHRVNQPAAGNTDPIGHAGGGLDEPEAARLVEAILSSERRWVAAPTAVEATAVARARRGPAAVVALEARLRWKEPTNRVASAAALCSQEA
jgi:hypothetical protein